MKRGYKRLLICELAIILVLILNNFVSSILSGYINVVFLLTLLVIFRFFLGYEKDRHHLWKSTCIEILIFLALYFILYYLSGIVISFTKTTNFLNFKGIFNVIIPLILTIVIKEILRYIMLTKAEGSRLLIVGTCITFILIDLVGLLDSSNFRSPYTIFIFLALVLLPIISKNIMCCYITYKVGYKPVILFLLIFELYSYYVPIVPNPDEYIYSIINFVLPFLLMFRLYVFFKKDEDEDIVRDYHKKRFGALIIPGLMVLFLVYITSGYFHYHAIVIASGSMEPNIHKGDVVIIEKIDGNYDLVKKGQVVAYKYNDLIIVHRLNKKIVVGEETFYYTKGDANNEIDNYKVLPDMIIGVVNIKIPYMGLPTVWLRNI